MMAARRADSCAGVELGKGGAGCFAVEPELNLFFRNRKIILTSSSRSQYSLSRRSRSCSAVGAADEADGVASSSRPHDAACVGSCIVGEKVGVNEDTFDILTSSADSISISGSGRAIGMPAYSSALDADRYALKAPG